MATIESKTLVTEKKIAKIDEASKRYTIILARCDNPAQFFKERVEKWISKQQDLLPKEMKLQLCSRQPAPSPVYLLYNKVCHTLHPCKRWSLLVGANAQCDIQLEPSPSSVLACDYVLHITFAPDLQRVMIHDLGSQTRWVASIKKIGSDDEVATIFSQPGHRGGNQGVLTLDYQALLMLHIGNSYYLSFDYQMRPWWSKYAQIVHK